MFRDWFTAGVLVGLVVAGAQPRTAMTVRAEPTVELAADAAAIARAQQRLDAALQSGAIDSPGQVVVVYFTPKDRSPAADHVARIRRIVETTADFYQRELKRHGFEDRRMNVLRDPVGEVSLIDVVGAQNDSDYGKSDGRKIRDEVVPVLRTRGIDPDASVILLFCNLMDYDPVAGTISHHSPYYGGGGHLSGTAWQCDSPILDPLRLTDPALIRDGQYGPITIGKHNSIFIGGVVHELGHALSLPHCRQRDDEAVRGTALMGSGNRTFGQELRGEGLGSFLTQAHALRLAAHPVFNRRVSSQVYDRPTLRWDELVIDVMELDTSAGDGNADRKRGQERVQERVQRADGVRNTVGKAANGNQSHAWSIRIAGLITSDIAVHGVVAYFDPAGGGDYDATTATAVPDQQGRFAMRGQPMGAGTTAALRLVACHVNGATSTRHFAFRIDADGRPDLTAIAVELQLGAVIEQLRDGTVTSAEQRLSEIAAGDTSLVAIGERILERFRTAEAIARDKPDVADRSIKAIPLTALSPISAKVGWRRPTYDRVPDGAKLLSVDGDYFASGIYAHAPAEHVYRLDGQWQRLRGICGVQSGFAGTVAFRIYGDDQLIWQSGKTSADRSVAYDVVVANVQTLRLVVTDAGDGSGGDWGVWIEPTLAR